MNAEELRKIALSSRDANLNAVARALAAHLEDEHGGGEVDEISEREWRQAVQDAEADRDRLQSELDEAVTTIQAMGRVRDSLSEKCDAAREAQEKAEANAKLFFDEHTSVCVARNEALAAKEKAEADHAIDSESGRRWMKDCRAAQARLKEAERHIDLVTTHLAGKSLEGAEYTDLASALDFLAPTDKPSPSPAEREAQEGDVLEMANGSKIHCGPVPDDEKLRSTQYDALVLDPGHYPLEDSPVFTPAHIEKVREEVVDALVCHSGWERSIADVLASMVCAALEAGDAPTPPEPQEDREND